MKCRYCHQSRLPSREVCLKCSALIAFGDWEQLATLQLFFHPEEWIGDVAAFIEISEHPAVVPATVASTSESVALSIETLDLVRSALVDAIDDQWFSDYCRDCSDVPCADHRAAAERRRRYQELYEQLSVITERPARLPRRAERRAPPDVST